jgi:hypothetical protein
MFSTVHPPSFNHVIVDESFSQSTKIQVISIHINDKIKFLKSKWY